MEHLTGDILNFISRTSYAGIFLVMVLGNMAIPVGTEVVLPVIGMLAATGRIGSPYEACAIAVIGEIVGGSLMWAVGRYGGVAFVHRFGKYVHISEAALAQIHRYYEQFGARTVFICRFLPVIRGVAALPAGLSGMSIFPFLAYSFAGSALFCGGFIALGYTLGRRINDFLPLIHRLGFASCAALVGVALVLAMMRKFRVI